MQILITGQQKIMLQKYIDGKLKETDLYKFLASRVDQIPYKMVQSSSDKECILWIYNNSKVFTNVHNSINFWQNYFNECGKKRCEHFIYKQR